MREDEEDERDCGRLPKARFASVRPLSVRLAAVQLAHLDELPEGQAFGRKIEYELATLSARANLGESSPEVTIVYSDIAEIRVPRLGIS